MAKKLQIKKGTFIGDSFIHSPIIYNITDTSSLSVGDVVAHADGLQVESKILSIDSATQITLDKKCSCYSYRNDIYSIIRQYYSRYKYKIKWLYRRCR